MGECSRGQNPQILLSNGYAYILVHFLVGPSFSFSFSFLLLLLLLLLLPCPCE